MDGDSAHLMAILLTNNHARSTHSMRCRTHIAGLAVLSTQTKVSSNLNVLLRITEVFEKSHISCTWYDNSHVFGVST